MNAITPYSAHLKRLRHFRSNYLRVFFCSVGSLIFCCACDDSGSASSPEVVGGAIAGETTADQLDRGTAGVMIDASMAGMSLAGVELTGGADAGVEFAGIETAGEPLSGSEAGEAPAGTDMAGVQMAGTAQAGEVVAGVDLAGMESAGVESGGGEPPEMACDATWLSLTDDELVTSLYLELEGSYLPLTPEPDRGGNLNRYTTARSLMFTEVERRVSTQSGDDDEGVHTIYTHRFIPLEPMTEPDHSEVNCEHLWPRSRLTSDPESLYEHQQSDLHHLFPTRSIVNSARGSQFFGEPRFGIDTSYEPALIGDDGNGRMVFLPIARRRGDVARALFYMSTRWGLDIPAHEEEHLRQWHLDDPVDAWEVERNRRVASHQGNRNPFVDCPELVERLDDFRAHDHAQAEVLPIP